MTRTSPATLVILGVVGLIVAGAAELALVGAGAPTFVPPYLMSAAFAATAVALVVAAIPVRRVASGRPGARVDPFYATRVVVFAKASALVAAFAFGAALAVLLYVSTRPVLASDLFWRSGAAVAATALLVGAALVAEGMCRLPPSEDEPEAEPS